jgi:hypothetical protein
MKQKYFNEEETQHINEILVPIRSARVVWIHPGDGTPPQQMPLVQLDASRRPDVADFARVTLLEGLPPGTRMPPFVYTMEPGYTSMLVSFDVTDPVECEFAFTLPWPQYREFFQGVIDSRLLFVTAFENLEGDISSKCIGLKVDIEELQEVLRIWQSGES